MHFLIVTPSYNQLDYLKRCIASVADQVAPEAQRSDVGGQQSAVRDYDLSVKDNLKPKTKNLKHGQPSITIHHHIQDGGSTDGTIDWLCQYDTKVKSQRSPNAQHLTPNTAVPGYTFSYESVPDEGMYDAINKGWLRGVVELAGNGGGRTRHQEQGLSKSEDSLTSDLRPPISNPARECVLAHLNCDEQYLPDALKTVAAFFRAHQEADVVLADMIVVDNDGAYICHRRSLKPHALLSRICCVGMTTTTFQRAAVVRDKGVLFDTSWRNIGDMVWYNALHRAGVHFSVCNELVSLFTDTGDNLNLTEEAIHERKRYADEYLFGMRRISRLISKFYSLRRYLKEFYLKPPIEYALFWSDLEKREVRKIKKATGLWHRKGPDENCEK